MKARFDPDELADLESERDFLLRSIADLESECQAGNLDAERYQSLLDDYTARAAAVLRSIEEGVDAWPVPPPVPLRRKVWLGFGLLGFAAVAAVLLAGALGPRQPGQAATGNAQSAGSDRAASDSQRRTALQRQVATHPEDPAAHLAYARFLLDSGDVGDALQEFDTAAKLDPSNAQAHAYAGWIVFLAARGADPKAAASLNDGALRRLDAAVAAQPDYPAAHFFRGMVLLRGKNDAKGAVPEFERYLALAPSGPEAPQVQQLLDLARQQSDSP